MTGILDLIWDYFRKPKPVPITDTPTITRDEIYKLLRNFTDNIYIGDNTYKTVQKSDMIAFLARNTVDERRYIVEAHDCDDYAFELMGDVSTWNPAGAFGIVWGNRTDGAPHAWNFFIGEDKKVWYVEPQNDKIFQPTTEKIWVMIL